MGGARQQLSFGEDQRGPLSQKQMVKRAVKAVVLILNPMVWLSWLVLIVPVARQRIVKPVWVLLVALVWLVVALWQGALKLYLVPYQQVVAAVKAVFSPDRAATPTMLGEGLVGWARTDAVAALLGQLWLAVPVALVWAALVALYRAKYSAGWRKKAKAPNAKQLEKAMKKLPLWPQEPDEVRELRDLEVLMGVDREDGSQVRLNAAALGKHMFIDGPSGEGKTTDLVTLFRGLIEAPAAQRLNLGLMFVNMKPDAELTEAMHRLAAVAGRRLHIITEDGRGASTSYNPLRYGTAEQARNIVIEAEAHSAAGGFSEAHYRHGAERYMLLAMDVLTELVTKGKRYKSAEGTMTTWKRDLPHLARILQWSQLQEQEGVLSPQLSARLRAYTVEMEEDRDMVKHGSGIRQRIANAVEGAAGAVLAEREDGLDLRSAFLAGDLVLFNLDSARDAQAARNIGNLALQDAAATLSELGASHWHSGERLERAARQPRPAPKNLIARRVWRFGESLRERAESVREWSGKLTARFKKDRGPVRIRSQFIVVDEFSALGGTILGDLFTRSRSNGGAVVLATQDSSDMDAESPVFKKSVWKNTATKILHRQEQDAEEYASLVGTQEDLAETQQLFDDRDILGTTTRHSGQGSLRTVESFVVHPNELRALQPGQAIVLGRDGVRRTNIRMMKVAPAPSAPARRPAPAPSAPPAANRVAAPEPATPAPQTVPNVWATAAANAKPGHSPEPAPRSEPAHEVAPAMPAGNFSAAPPPAWVEAPPED